MVTMTTSVRLGASQNDMDAAKNDIACGKYVFCAGMPRSGSTWQYQIVSHLLEERRGGVRGGFLERADDFARIEEQTAGRTPWLTLKTHNGYPPYAQAIRDGRAVAVYSYRDLRDVAYSLMHKMKMSFAEVVEKRFMLGQCLNDDRFWRALPGVLCQRYEDIMSDPVTRVKEIAFFLGLPIADADAVRLAATYSLEANRSRQQQLTQKLREKGVDLDDPRNAVIHDEHTQLHWNHIRQGRIGGWRDEATPEERILLANLCGAWLVEQGYETEAHWVLPGVKQMSEDLAAALRELRVVQEQHAKDVGQLHALNELGPFALGIAFKVHRIVQWFPRVRGLLKGALRRCGVRAFSEERTQTA
jgi:Sulfotransferase domain